MSSLLLLFFVVGSSPEDLPPAPPDLLLRRFFPFLEPSVCFCSSYVRRNEGGDFKMAAGGERRRRDAAKRGNGPLGRPAGSLSRSSMPRGPPRMERRPFPAVTSWHDHNPTKGWERNKKSFVARRRVCILPVYYCGSSLPHLKKGLLSSNGPRCGSSTARPQNFTKLYFTGAYFI